MKNGWKPLPYSHGNLEYKSKDTLEVLLYLIYSTSFHLIPHFLPLTTHTNLKRLYSNMMQGPLPGCQVPLGCQEPNLRASTKLSTLQGFSLEWNRRWACLGSSPSAVKRKKPDMPKRKTRSMGWSACLASTSLLHVPSSSPFNSIQIRSFIGMRKHMFTLPKQESIYIQ